MIIGRDHAGAGHYYGPFEEKVEIKRHGAATGEVKKKQQDLGPFRFWEKRPVSFGTLPDGWWTHDGRKGGVGHTVSVNQRVDVYLNR
jgi:hypothetical protein